VTTFRKLTVGHTAHRVVFGHSAFRYVMEAYIVSSEAGASANVKAAVIAYAMNSAIAFGLLKRGGGV
jgi:hypothetical protein